MEYRTQFPNGEGAQDRCQSGLLWVMLQGGPEGPDYKHWLQRACCPLPRMQGGSQQSSHPLCELSWGCFSSICSSTADKNLYTLKAGGKKGWSHPCSTLLSCLPFQTSLSARNIVPLPDHRGGGQSAAGRPLLWVCRASSRAFPEF